jgi:hypothetical protein
MHTEQTPCSRQEELVAETQRHLVRLAELAKQEAEAIASRDEALILALDQDIENTLGLKERALGALHEHRNTHNC